MNNLTKDNYRSQSRRTFLEKSAAGILGLALTSPLNLHGNSLSGSGKIALQLYTVRREIEKDLQGTLNKVSQLGYKYVETAFWPENISIEEAGAALRKAGLKVCSIHCELPTGKEKSNWLAMADAYDCTSMIWHGWPEDPRYKTREGIEELANIYNEASDFAQSQGLAFGLHNHWWEFRNKIDGLYPYQILGDYLSSDIFFEIDTYWVKVAGYDPAEIVGKAGAKAPFLHIKDGPARYTESLGKDQPEPMVAVGKGTQNFPEIVRASNGHTRWMIVEMDVTATDVFTALEESYYYLTSNSLATTE